MPLHEFHQRLNARFTDVQGVEMVATYGDVPAEYAALLETAAVLDLSGRGRLCLTGADRQRFLNGQVTNDVKGLPSGRGCYAALVTAKGRLECDLNVWCLAEELLLDFEPGLQPAVVARLDKYIIADDVQIVDAAPHYGLLVVMGPAAGAVVGRLDPNLVPPATPMAFVRVQDPELGEMYCMNNPRGPIAALELFVPTAALEMVADRLIASANAAGGRAAGWEALEMARIEAGLPRFGVDMDTSNLAPEAGVEARAISYSKGCYIGQEVIARLRTYGQVAKALRGLRLSDDLASLPAKGAKLFHGGREVGYITSATRSPRAGGNVALGYVRKECNEIGTELTLAIDGVGSNARIVPTPFSNQ